MEVFLRHSGTMLAADEAPQIVEGQSDRDRVVLMKFPDETAFREYAESLIINGFQKIVAPAPTRWCCLFRH